MIALESALSASHVYEENEFVPDNFTMGTRTLVTSPTPVDEIEMLELEETPDITENSLRSYKRKELIKYIMENRPNMRCSAYHWEDLFNLAKDILKNKDYRDMPQRIVP